jgi:hypothetical protein
LALSALTISLLPVVVPVAALVELVTDVVEVVLAVSVLALGFQ